MLDDDHVYEVFLESVKTLKKFPCNAQNCELGSMKNMLHFKTIMCTMLHLDFSTCLLVSFWNPFVLPEIRFEYRHDIPSEVAF